MQFDTNISYFREPGRTATTEDLQLAPLNIDLQQIYALSASQMQETRDVPSLNGCLGVLTVAFANLSCPFTAITKRSPREYQFAALRPNRTKYDLGPVPVWSEILAAQFEIAGVWLDGHNLGSRKTTQQIGARIANIRSKIQDDTGRRDVSYAGVFIKRKDLMEKTHVT